MWGVLKCASPVCGLLQAAAREYQAAAGGATHSKAPASTVPEGHCFFFLKGPAGCAKGSACKFIHDEVTCLLPPLGLTRLSQHRMVRC